MDWGGIGVFVEHFMEKPHEGSLEVLGKARELGDKYGEEVIAFVLAGKEYGWIRDLVKYGADRVVYAINPIFSHYLSDAYTQGMAQLIRAKKPMYMLFSVT